MRDLEPPRPDETEIAGRWVFDDGRMVGDASCSRVEKLRDQYFEQVASDPSGWNILFRDPADGRLWELTFPQGEMHGGGPPMLRVVVPGRGASKFEIPQ